MFFILASAANALELYKCNDRDGNVIITDSPQDGMTNCVFKDSGKVTSRKEADVISEKESQVRGLIDTVMDRSREKILFKGIGGWGEKQEEKYIERGLSARDIEFMKDTLLGERQRKGKESGGGSTCVSDCGVEQGTCRGDCRNDTKCSQRCTNAWSRCVSRCH